MVNYFSSAFATRKLNTHWHTDLGPGHGAANWTGLAAVSRPSYMCCLCYLASRTLLRLP